jgi:hypothetical protein
MVAGAIFACTAAWISASQSMLDDTLLPFVVIVLDELEPEEALLTVMTKVSS